MESDLKQFTKRMQELINENEKLKKLAGSYVDNAKSVLSLKKEFDDFTQAFTEKLDELANKIDPVLELEGRRKKREMKPIYDELYDGLKSGIHITRDFLEEKYPEFSGSEIGNLLTKLQTLPDIEKTKDAKNVRLFHKHG